MNDADKLSGGLFYEDMLPLSWQEIGQTLTVARALKTHQSNEQLLRHFAAIDEQRPDVPEEEHGEVGHEIARLEFKLNLLLDMMGQLLTRHVAIPDPVPVRMSADALQWTSAKAPGSGRRVSVDIYLNAKYPSPITLFGIVDKVETNDGGFLIGLTYTDMSEGMRNAIEKMIFRQHRRMVAQTRQTARNRGTVNTKA